MEFPRGNRALSGVSDGISAIGERISPQAIHIERAVLGAMLIDKTAIGTVVEILDETSFYRTAHRHIYEVIVSLYDRDEPADVITVVEELNRRKQLDEVDGPVFIATLATDVATAANVKEHAEIVLDKALRRKLMVICGQITTECYEETEPIKELLEIAQQGIFALAQTNLRQGFRSIESIMHETIDEIEDSHKTPGSVSGLPTGFRELDDRTAGFQNSDLIVIAGRTSMGKTALALNITRNLAIKHETPVAIFSLEMSTNQLAKRLLSSEARIDGKNIRVGRLNDEEWTRLGVRVGEIASAPIFVDDSFSLSVLEMRSKARRIKAEQDIGLLIVDYMQLMSSPVRREGRVQEVSDISRSLKGLAKELDIPVIALSQLSRLIDQRADHRPMLSDLRESGTIEQDADVVLFIYRPEVYGVKYESDGETSVEGMAEIIIGKQRNGPTGTVYLTWIEEYARFEDPELYRDEPF